MAKSELPYRDARFWPTDPRFVIIDGIHYPVLLTDSLEGKIYSEVLGNFDGLREKFVASAERLKMAVLANPLPSDNWHMSGLYQISAIQSYGEPFVCQLGNRVARLREVCGDTA